MYPSDKRPRTYASGASKRREKKQKLENAVHNTVKMESYFAAKTMPVVSQCGDEQTPAGLNAQSQVSVQSVDANLAAADNTTESATDNIAISVTVAAVAKSFRREFAEEIKNCESVKDVLTVLVSSDVLSSMPELGTACILFCTLPVTVASAERSFSKLKLIKSYLRSSIAQERLDSLALISIENEAARQLDLNELVDKFAGAKARKKQF